MVRAAEEGRIRIFASEEIMREISRVLDYPKLKRVYQAAGLHREDLVGAILRIVKLVEVTKSICVVIDGHPADDKYVECALAAGARYIVSGDKHLPKIASHEKTRIL